MGLVLCDLCLAVWDLLSRMCVLYVFTFKHVSVCACVLLSVIAVVDCMHEIAFIVNAVSRLNRRPVSSTPFFLFQYTFLFYHFQRITSSMLSALFEELGVDTAVDEYFFREMVQYSTLTAPVSISPLPCHNA